MLTSPTLPSLENGSFCLRANSFLLLRVQTPKEWTWESDNETGHHSQKMDCFLNKGPSILMGHRATLLMCTKLGLGLFPLAELQSQWSNPIFCIIAKSSNHEGLTFL